MVISEKATALASNLNQYTFKVFQDVNRVSIARAVEKTFNVHVKQVNTIKVKPKLKPVPRCRGKVGYRSGMKKAIVILKEGDKIEIF